MSENNHFLPEAPISGKEIKDDLFNFNVYADKIKELIQKNSSSKESFTVGVYGKWGHGKTSFTNLIKNKIEYFEKGKNGKEYLVYEFNPWRYSTEDEMLFDFFDGLAKRFYVEKKDAIQNVGTWIEKYSKYLKVLKIPLQVKGIDIDISEFTDALGKDLKGNEITIESLKNKVNEEIKKAKFKIVIFIDDIDRLDKDEIYTILKLVKLNANFDDFIFILNFDDEQVSKAIKDRYGDEIVDGKSFLEKIINIPIHLPKIEVSYLNKYFDDKLQEVFSKLNFSNNEMVKISFNSIRNSFYSMEFSNPREVIRVLNSFYIGAFTLNEEVDLDDLFWIEWIKIKHMNLYQDLKSISTHLTNIPIDVIYQSGSPDGFKYQIQNIIEKHQDLKTILNYLFVNESDKKSLNLVRKAESFDRYFSYHIGNKTSITLIYEILSCLSYDKESRLLDLFSKLYKNEDGFYKVLELIWEIREKKNQRDILYKNLILNIELVEDTNEDMFGIHNRIRIIELIAKYLNEDLNNNEDISKEIATILDVYQLCYFTRKFNIDKSPFKIELEKIIADKADKTFNVDLPIYFEPSNPVKMIMHYWKLQKPEIFDKHIKDSLISLIRVKKLIRNFPSFWNNSYYGALTKENFHYMKTIIDLDFVFSKIEEFDKVIVKNIDINHFPAIDEHAESSEDDNLNQFIYWYKTEY